MKLKPARIKGLALVLSLLLAGCSPSQMLRRILCGETVTFASIAPDEKHTAFIFQRSCGATTVASTLVALQPGFGGLNDDDENLIFAVGWIVPAGVFWTDSSHLRVQFLGLSTDKVFLRKEYWRGVTVSYESYGKIETDDRSLKPRAL